MTANKQEIFDEIRSTFGLVPQWMEELPPAALDGFWRTMRDFYLGDTAIPRKYKELIGVAVAGATRCRYCALFHSEGAKLEGASDEEIAEASAMAGFTNLGSSFVNGQQTDFERFADETRRAVDYVRKNAPRPQQAKRPSQAPQAEAEAE